ncbi:hypothetical protein E2C01_040863 [Portunus trituberculatus]|uniref:Uncharacterized protein n=1 Tax=Portunus trituberculatus TaxID=210409 RepID=A0A5B7FQD1_PORTR|nr:hypothetical protein [Portunus trituberculatus]
MESTGQPGQVHVSEATYKFLPEDTYITTEGSEHKGLKTYFIHGYIRKEVSSELIGDTEGQYITYKPAREDDSKKSRKTVTIKKKLEALDSYARGEKILVIVH